MLLFELSLPFTEPVQIFFIILLIILLAPLLFARLKIPSVIGLILAGTLVGPEGLHMIERTDTTLFGTVGLLYIMFIAGLEIDLNDFRKYRHKSIGFGAFTFLVPLIMGTLASIFILDYPFRSALLLASMFSTHTLIAYPIASRLGITKNKAVTITVGGTMITDTAALLVLVIITSSIEGVLNVEFWLRLVSAIAAFVFIVLWGFPKIGRWFYRNAENEGVIHYIFALTMVFAAAFLAEVAGLEPIIGAFLAGLALNRLVPHSSPLMNRIEFVGNALFIPFFLINVGMLVNPGVLTQGTEALVVAGVLTAVALSSKWLAAFFTQKVFRLNILQRNVIFGLSSGHAAATIAIILVAYRLDLLDDNVLNGTIILILITCMVSSFVTDRAGRKLALDEVEHLEEEPTSEEKILVPIANPNTLEALIDLAMLLKQKNAPIYPLSVILDDHQAKTKVATQNRLFSKSVQYAAGYDQAIHPVSRVDLNASSGILRTTKELGITKIVMGWNGKLTASSRFFGSVLDSIVERAEQTIVVAKIIYPLNTIGSIMVVVAPNAHLEAGFAEWISMIRVFGNQTTGKVQVVSDATTLEAVARQLEDGKPSLEVVRQSFDNWDDFLILAREVSPQDVMILVSARPNTVSYHDYLEKIPDYLSKYFTETSFMIVYPGLDI